MNSIALSNDFKEILFGNSMFFAIAVSAIFGKILQESKTSIFKMWIMFFVGTFAHELAHFIVGVITFGFPYKFSVIPHKNKEGSGYVMGHVKCFNMRWYNIFWISMAPLLLIPMSYVVFKHFFEYFNPTMMNFAIWIFLIVSLLFSSIPSGVDFKNIARGNLVLNLFGGVIIFLVWYSLYYIGVIEWFRLMIISLIR